jgi:aspartate carbamoyltransferase regulatory subunit
LHLFQMIKTKTWFFVPFVIGGFCKCPHHLCISHTERD